MTEMLKRGDTNKDGALDKGELKKLFDSFRNRDQRPGARPEGGNRPQRPEQPGRSKRDQKSRKEQPRREKPKAEKKVEA